MRSISRPLFVSLALLALSLSPRGAHTQEWCDGEAYFAFGDVGVGSTLNRLQFGQIGGVQFIPEISTPFRINGFGISPIDGLLYAWDMDNQRMVTIDRVGSITNITPVGFPGDENLVAGGVSLDGNTWILGSTNGGLNEFYTIDISVSPVAWTGPGMFSGSGVADLAQSPTTSQWLALGGTGVPGGPLPDLQDFNPATGALSSLNISGFAPSFFGYGGVFPALDGFVYAYNNDGEFYRVDLGAGTAAMIANAPVDIRNADGAACNFQGVNAVELGDFLWNDTNSNGIQDSGEPGLAGQTVNLYSTGTCNGPTSMSMTTDSMGEYSFVVTEGSTVCIEFETLPAGFAFTSQDQGGNDALDSDADSQGRIQNILVGASDDLTLDAGATAPAAILRLGDFLWHDTNGNGIQDGGEPGLDGETVRLYESPLCTGPVSQTTTTSGGGAYGFDVDECEPPIFGEGGSCDACIEFASLPGGFVFTFQNQGSDDALDSDADGQGRIQNISYDLDSILTLDAGAVIPTLAVNLGDRLWDDQNGNGIQDGGEPGVGGETVNFYTNPTCAGTPITTTTTGAAGDYSFISGGNETVCIEFATRPSGTVFTLQDQGGNDAIDSDADALGRIQNIVVLSSDIFTLDAGLLTPLGVVELGDFLWNDLDRDGIQDAGEPGLEGQTVELYDNGTCAGTPIDTQATGAGGVYRFRATEGATVCLDFATLPAGFEFTLRNQGGDDTTDSDVTPNGQIRNITVGTTSDLTLDAGAFVPLAVVQLGDFLWNDLNRDGIQDGGEPGLGGQTVELYSNGTCAGTATATTTTDSNGAYSFDATEEKVACLDFASLPAGFEFTLRNQGGDDTTDSDVTPNGQIRNITVGTTSDLTLDAGAFVPLGQVQLGDFLWNDKNRNGVQDSGEPGLNDQTVNLYPASNCSGPTSASVLTDTNGAYSFDVTEGDTACIEFETLPVGFEFTGRNQGGDDATDSDVNAQGQIRNLTVGATSDFTLDAGAFVPLGQVQLGDFLWNDLNRDGIQDVGEPGLEGETVNLYPAGNCSGPTSASVQTDSNGGYSFDVTEGDSACIEFETLPGGFEFTQSNQGGDDTTDSDVNAQGQIRNLTVGPTSDFTLDAGAFRPPAQVVIGDYLWEDLDSDGIQDPREPGIEGQGVFLFVTAGALPPGARRGEGQGSAGGEGGCSGTPSQTASTDAQGGYSFNVTKGQTLCLEFEGLDGMEFTAQDQGGNDARDSDVNSAGQIDGIVVGATDDLTLDAGMRAVVPVSLQSFEIE